VAQAQPQQQDHLSDYERAVCYYTLPRVTHPITYGLIAAYALCLFEALAAIVYGLWFDHDLVLRIGTIAFAALIAFGLVVFTVRAFLSEVRQRRALAQARGVPDALREAADLPDPFATHLLLKRPTHTDGAIFACTDEHAAIAYRIEATPENASWTIMSADGEEVCRVKAVRRVTSFTFGQNLPGQLNIYRQDTEIGQIIRRFSFTENITDIRVLAPEPSQYQVRQQAIYRESRLVGRIYALRGAYYLDLRRDALHEAILAYFIAATD